MWCKNQTKVEQCILVSVFKTEKNQRKILINVTWKIVCQRWVTKHTTQPYINTHKCNVVLSKMRPLGRSSQHFKSVAVIVQTLVRPIVDKLTLTCWMDLIYKHTLIPCASEGWHGAPCSAAADCVDYSGFPPSSCRGRGCCSICCWHLLFDPIGLAGTEKRGEQRENLRYPKGVCGRKGGKMSEQKTGSKRENKKVWKEMT